MKPEAPLYSSLPPLQIAQAIGVTLLYEDALKVDAFLRTHLQAAYSAGFDAGVTAKNSEKEEV